MTDHPAAPLAIVTATTNVERARPCIESWITHSTLVGAIVVIHNGPEPAPETFAIGGMQIAWIHRDQYLGSVPAFRLGVDVALTLAPIIACFHDDFEILEEGWDRRVIHAFQHQPNLGLAGFGGAIALGHEDLYRKPYDPMSLARGGFRSNLVDAEAHGVRSLLKEQVACLDGFSQIGRAEFFRGIWSPAKIRAVRETGTDPTPVTPAEPVWQELERLGIVHHLYDSLLGALAARHGWETWYLPLRAQHHGGRTAVGDAGYGDWAKTQVAGGDHGFWTAAHRIGYEAFKDVLPLRV